MLGNGASAETPDEDEVRRARRSMMRSPVTVVVTQAGEADGGPGGPSRTTRRVAQPLRT